MTGSLSAGGLLTWRLERVLTSILSGTFDPSWSDFTLFPTALAYRSDGDVLALGMKDGRILFRNMLSGRIQKSIRAHEGPVRSLAYSPNGDYLLSGGGRARVFRARDGKLLASYPKNPRSAAGEKKSEVPLAFSRVAVHPDGRHFAHSTREGRIILRRLPPLN